MFQQLLRGRRCRAVVGLGERVPHAHGDAGQGVQDVEFGQVEAGVVI